jgi:hypothetical protein
MGSLDDVNREGRLFLFSCYREILVGKLKIENCEDGKLEE